MAARLTLAFLSVLLLTSTGLSYFTRGVAAGIMLIFYSWLKSRGKSYNIKCSADEQLPPLDPRKCVLVSVATALS